MDTPWSSINPIRFLRDVATAAGGLGEGYAREAILTVCARPSVATGLWWTITWLDESGTRHSGAAQDLALLMRRAAETELAARAAWEGEDNAEDGRELRRGRR